MALHVSDVEPASFEGSRRVYRAAGAAQVHAQAEAQAEVGAEAGAEAEADAEAGAEPQAVEPDPLLGAVSSAGRRVPIEYTAVQLFLAR